MGSMRKTGSMAALIFAAAACVMLSGCGKDTKELDAYYDCMNSFTTEITAIKDNMESIDVNSADAPAQILGYMDQMQEQFRILSEAEVPKEFASNEQLADEAYEYMQTAVTMYREYYDDPESDRAVFDAATANYERAMKRVNYISYILRGEIPEGEGISVIEDDTDFTPVTEEGAEDGIDEGEEGAE